MIVDNRQRISVTILSLVFVGLGCNFILGTQPTGAPPATEAVIPHPTNTPESLATTTPGDISAPTSPTIEATEAEQKPDPSPTNPPNDTLAVTAIEGYPDISSGWRIVGLIVNNSERTVDNVQVEIQILDSEGNPLHTEITTALLYTLSPGETSPFMLWVSEELLGADNFKATIVGQSNAEIERPEYELRGVTLTIDDEGDIHITGEMVNIGEQPITVNGLAAATFDARGTIITADYMDVSIHYLDPGESGPFRVTMLRPSEGVESVDSYNLYTDFATTAEEETLELIFSENQYVYFDSFDSFHLVGDVTNNTDKVLSISMVAGIYDAEGNVIDAATQDIFVSAAPGENLPFDFDSWGPLNSSAEASARANTYSVQWDPYWTQESSSDTVNLTTQNDNNQYDDFQGIFTGEVFNDSGESLTSAIVIVSLYDQASGEIIATDFTGVWEEIPDGDSFNYTVAIDLEPDFDPQSVEYVIIVKGELP